MYCFMHVWVCVCEEIQLKLFFKSSFLFVRCCKLVFSLKWMNIIYESMHLLTILTFTQIMCQKLNDSSS